ncbi:MAG: helix-turn-helix transcriptional regulator [Clostridia bacterium]|nr:helix-turn-helix transcriptional regulator [Clostridia bacterium]
MISDAFKRVTPILKVCNLPYVLPHDDDSYGMRTVEHYELEYICSGSGMIVVDGIPRPIIPHSINFRRPGMDVEGIGIYEAYFFTFDMNEQGTTIPELEQLPITYPLVDYQRIGELFRQIYHEYDTPGPTQLLHTQILLLQLFDFMIDYAESVAPVQQDHTGRQNIQKSVLYIRQHFSEDITLPKLAKVSGYSIYHYNRVFKRCTGMSPIRFLNDYRLNRAKYMILTENMPLEQIAAACGFNQYSYFYRLFRTAYGSSPAQFRKKHAALNLQPE